MVTIEETVQEFRTFMKKASYANVMIAASDKESEGELILQRLTLAISLGKDFFQYMLSEFVQETDEIVFKKYDPGYKPETGEICYVSLGQSRACEERNR